MVRFLALFLLLLIPLKASAMLTEDIIVKSLNLNCIDFRVHGICVKKKHGKIKIGIRISYYLPVAVVETPPVPYKTELKPLAPALRAAEPAVERLISQIPIFSKLGTYEFGGNIEDHEDTFYREAHICSSARLATLSVWRACCRFFHLVF